MKLAASISFLLLALWQMADPAAAVAANFRQKDLGFNHTREYTRIGTRTYHYLLAPPSSNFNKPVVTIVLIHGFPDLSYGWRYQIPYLTSLGYRVIAPDMLGYGRSSSPLSLDKFSLKNMSDDLAKLVRSVVGKGQQVILGGHDWGGAMVYRAALYHPDLYRGIFSVCTPYFPPVTKYVDLKDQIDAGITPTFGYQLQLRDRSIDKHLLGPAKIRQTLLALYGGRTPEGEMGFDAHTGLILKNLPKLGPSPLISESDLDYYVAEYVKNGMRGPLSWYRTAKINFDDELPLAKKGKVNFAMPGLYIGATMDTALPPELSEGMEEYFPKGLTRGEVESSHWALWQAARGVNEIIAEWAAGLDAPGGGHGGCKAR